MIDRILSLKHSAIRHLFLFVIHTNMHPLLNNLEKILVSEEAIKNRIAKLGVQIAEDYKQEGIDEIIVIAITNGAIIFAADLLRKLPINTRLDCVRVSTYKDDTSPQGEPEIIDSIRANIHGRHVLMIDDILDTGRTCTKIVRVLSEKNPASIKTCMLLDKKGRREINFEADYVGFEIPNEFVVGYGLDFAELYRSLPCIGVVKADLQNPPEWT